MKSVVELTCCLVIYNVDFIKVTDSKYVYLQYNIYNTM